MGLFLCSVVTKVKSIWAAVENLSASNLLVLKRDLPKVLVVAGFVLTILWISLLVYLPLYLFLPVITAMWG